MKNVLFVLLCLFIATAASADVKIVQKVKSGPIMGQQPKDSTISMSVKGKKARVDTGEKGDFQIIDLEAGKVYLVETQKKAIRVVTTAMMKEMSGMVGQMTGNQGKPAVEKLGTSHTYNGFKCEDYKISMTGIMTMNSVTCVAADLSIAEFEQFKEFGQDFTKAFGMDAGQEIKGLPVHTKSTIEVMGQKVDSTSELVSISRDPLPDSLFVIPADYKIQEMKMPEKK